MTEDEALKKLAEIVADGDPEGAHRNADELVRDALRALGWTRLADAYWKASDDWWYA